MKVRWLLWISAVLGATTLGAQESRAPRTVDACLRLDNRVLGPRTSDRPLPLLSGDAAHGFHPACTVAWRTLSPRNEPLPVTDCFRGNLLRIPNESACGTHTGPLWVSTRWVMTSAELEKPAVRAATCQQLDTGAWAGTRAFDFDCVPRKPKPGRDATTAGGKSPAPATVPNAAPASVPPR